MAMVHLARATVALNDVYLQQDHPDNLRARAFLRAKAEIGDPVARDALTVFTQQNGIESVDVRAASAETVRLFKTRRLSSGDGLYPQGTTATQIVRFVVKHPEFLRSILHSRSVVVKQGRGGYVGIPYASYYAKTMREAVQEILFASARTTHEGFADYLRMEAAALQDDQHLEAHAKAEEARQRLTDCPIDFAITRNPTRDKMSAKIAADPRIAKLMAEQGVTASGKEFLGVRLGLAEGTDRAAHALSLVALGGELAAQSAERNRPPALRQQPLYEALLLQ